MLRWLLVLVGVVGIHVAALSVPGLAQTDAAISGTVGDTAGAPLADICIRIYRFDIAVVTDVETAADGTYTATGLEPGDFKVSATDCNNFVYGTRWYDDESNIGTATVIPVAAGETATGIDFTLPELGTITGTVTDDVGTLLDGICAFAHNVDGTGGLGTATDATGAYAILGLEPGDYQIEFSDCTNNAFFPEWYQDQPTQATADVVSVAEGAVVAGIDAVLDTPPANGTIGGTVTDAGTGQPLEGICVTAWTTGLTPVEAGNATTAADGGYVVIVDDTGPVEDDFNVEFVDCTNGAYATVWHSGAASDPVGISTLATPVTVVKGEVTPVDMAMRPPGALMATVTGADTGAPLPGICVYGTIQDLVVASAVTDGSGQYTLSLPQGTYNVLFADCATGAYQSRWNPDDPDPDVRVVVTVTAGVTDTSLFAVMEPGEGAIAIPPGETAATTDFTGDGATPDDPIETTVFSGSYGLIVIDEGPDGGIVLDGRITLPQQVRLHLPIGLEAGDFTAFSTIVFVVDATVVPAGDTPAVFRDGTEITEICEENAEFQGTCIQSSDILEDGDVRIVIQTTVASVWQLAVAQVDPPPTTTTTAPPTTTSPPVVTTTPPEELPATGGVLNPLAGLGLLLAGAALLTLSRRRGG